jgi:nucleoside-diphosphate kinase
LLAADSVTFTAITIRKETKFPAGETIRGATHLQHHQAVRKGFTGAILAEIAKAGFQIVAIKKQSISKEQAKGFYAVHAGKPFFEGLCEFMSSGPLVLMVLEKENAIADWRKLMGATNPANAEEGTLRKKFAGSMSENAVHGSDGEETAAYEIGYWFAGYELI